MFRVVRASIAVLFTHSFLSFYQSVKSDRVHLILIFLFVNCFFFVFAAAAANNERLRAYYTIWNR